MGPAEERRARDRRGTSRDRRRRFYDRRVHGTRFTPPGFIGRVIHWATGPWSSANGLSWFRLAVLLVIVRWGFLAIFTIPSSSMEPTLHGDPRFVYGDRVAVNKLAFGPRIPFTKTRLFNTGEPKRWDVVVFDAVSPGSSEAYLIKRIVGLPGEKVQILGPGSLFGGEPQIRINGEVLELPDDLADDLNYLPTLVVSDDVVHNWILNFADFKIPDEITLSRDGRIRGLRKDLKALEPDLIDLAYWELSDEEKAAMLSAVHPESLDLVRDWWTDKTTGFGKARYGILSGPRYTTVPEGHYFCLGDNGPESVDGRFFGWVPKENLVGRAFAVVYPPTRLRDLTGFSRTAEGALLLFGLIAFVLSWEIIPGFCIFSWKLRGPIAAVGLQARDRVLVSRIAYGLRLPFSNRHLWWRRDPEPGEVVCYALSRERGHGVDLYVGDVRAGGDGAGTSFSVRGPEDEGERWFDVGRDEIIGRVQSVWWPPSRRGAVNTIEKL